MDLIAEISKMFMSILLTCAFGSNVSDLELDYYKDGVKLRKDLGFMLRDVF